MATRRGRSIAAAIVFAAVTGGLGLAVARAQPPKIKTTEAPGFVGIEGKESFAVYCAACHGSDGKGHGPAAPALKMPVPDLTMLGTRPGGFNEIAIQLAILGSDRMPAAHGSMTMPIWGPIFRSTRDESVTQLRVRNLVEYPKGLQAKS